MPKTDSPSQALAGLLRKRRMELGLSLRDVERETEAIGQRIGFTTLGNIERGRVEPGVKRLHTLLRFYDLSPSLVAEVVDLEQFATERPLGTLTPFQLYEEGRRHWSAGNLREALAHLFELRHRSELAEAERVDRQRALIFLSVAVGGVGKFSLAKMIIEDLLLEGVDPSLLVPALVQQAACWHSLGQQQVAIAVTRHAESLLAADDAKNRAWVLHMKATVLFAMRETGEAESAAESAEKAYRDAGDIEGAIRLGSVTFKLMFEQKRFSEAAEVARRGGEVAEQHGFRRLETIRKLDEGRALLAMKEDQSGFEALNGALAKSIATGDQVLQFYAHFHLWQAYASRKDRRAADLELHACQYLVESIDEVTPEVSEIRSTMRRDSRS